MTICKIVSDTRFTRYISFGLLDGKRREVGINVTTWQQEATEIPGATTGCVREPGFYFCAYCHPTRDRKPFGALQSYWHFRTAVERDAYIERRVASTRKRYSKLYGFDNRHED
jgi:hypothetical protein